MTKLKDAAERYATGNHRASFPDDFEMKAFIAGARWGLEAACKLVEDAAADEHKRAQARRFTDIADAREIALLSVLGEIRSLAGEGEK